jgi:gamma-glutamyltranspeptidase / glutathione hydrolase
MKVCPGNSKAAYLAGAALFFIFLIDPHLLEGADEVDAASVRCRHGAVVSVSSPASDVGLAILKKSGNAVDSAVATAFALAVTHPAAGNIGGGGYMLVVPSAGESQVIDFREIAPAAAMGDMFGSRTGAGSCPLGPIAVAGPCPARD